MAKKFRDLTEPEILALAISLEEEDSRIYGEFADGLRERYPASAAMFDEMQVEETTHHSRLLEMFRQRFGQHIPAHQAAGRERLRRAAPRVAGPSAWSRRRARPGRNDGARDAPFLRARDGAHQRRVDPAAAGRAGRDRARALRESDDAREGTADAGDAQGRGRGRRGSCSSFKSSSRASPA